MSTTAKPPSPMAWFIPGASRGLGVEVARAALDRGDSVAATARNPQHLVAALGSRPNLLPPRLDVTSEAEAVAAAAAAVDRFGRIDTLVNNAGYGLVGAVEEASAEEVERIYRPNVFGLLAVARAVLPRMRGRRSGYVINMSSPKPLRPGLAQGSCSCGCPPGGLQSFLGGAIGAN